MTRNYSSVRPNANTAYKNSFGLTQNQINAVNYLITVGTLELTEDVQKLKENEIQITYKQAIDISTVTTGSISFPSNSTLNEEILGAFGNAVLSTVDGSGKVLYEEPTGALGGPITANLNNLGNWVASNTYVNSVVLLYTLNVSQVNYSNWLAIEKANVIDLVNFIFPTHRTAYITADYLLEDSSTFIGTITVKNVTSGPLNINTEALDKFEGEDTTIIKSSESFSIGLYQINDYRIL